MKVFELLECVRQSPGLYLGRPSVHDLFVFLNGYETARFPRKASPSHLNIALTPEEEAFYDEFQPWLQRRLGVRSVTSWAKLIMLSCHDEKAGFEQFLSC
jgi:hypothetical protein